MAGGWFLCGGWSAAAWGGGEHWCARLWILLLLLPLLLLQLLLLLLLLPRLLPQLLLLLPMPVSSGAVS